MLESTFKRKVKIMSTLGKSVFIQCWDRFNRWVGWEWGVIAPSTLRDRGLPVNLQKAWRSPKKLLPSLNTSVSDIESLLASDKTIEANRIPVIILEFTVSESKLLWRYLGTKVRNAVTIENSSVAAQVTNMKIVLDRRERKALGSSGNKHNQIKSSLYSRYYAQACNEWRDRP